MTKENSGFFGSLVGLDTAQAAAACRQEDARLLAEIDDCRASLEEQTAALLSQQRALAEQLDSVKREAKEKMIALQGRRQKLAKVRATFRDEIEKQETHFLWVRAVREICGHAALDQIYTFMREQRALRKQGNRNQQNPPTVEH